MDFGKETKDFGNVSQSDAADGLLQTIGLNVDSSLSFVEPVNSQSDTGFPPECYSNYIELEFEDDVRKDIENNRLPTQVGNSLPRLQSQYGGQSQLQVRAPCMPLTDLRDASKRFCENPISFDGLQNLSERERIFVFLDAKGNRMKTFSVPNAEGEAQVKVCLLEEFAKVMVQNDSLFPLGCNDWRNIEESSKKPTILFIKSKFHFVRNGSNDYEMDVDRHIDKLLNQKWIEYKNSKKAKMSSEAGRS